MNAITVNKLKKFYSVEKKEPGIVGSIKSLLNRRYEQVKAVNNISFSIKEGELIGFIGPNGAGKTTTLKVLSGLLHPTSGEVEVLGFKPWLRPPQLQKQFALVMGQKNQLWWDLPPQETFLLNKEIYEIPDNEYDRTIKALVKLLDIEKILSVPVRKLSLGQRMKCELVAALLHNPKVLFLDEPTIGLDVVMQKVMRDFIKTYNEKFKATIILTSHYMDDVKELAKRVIIIDNGKILYDGQLSSVIEKYARNKILTVIFASEPNQRRLAELGDVTEYQFPQAVIKVKRQETSQKASVLLREFPVADLTIEEPPIEAIIREIFSGKE